MFRNVLAGIDGSASATQALARAIEMARASGGRLGLLSVAASPSPCISLQRPPFVPPISTPQLAAQMQADAQHQVHEAERAVHADGELELADGGVADALGGVGLAVDVVTGPDAREVLAAQRELADELGRRASSSDVEATPAA